MRIRLSVCEKQAVRLLSSTPCDYIDQMHSTQQNHDFAFSHTIPVPVSAVWCTGSLALNGWAGYSSTQGGWVCLSELHRQEAHRKISCNTDKMLEGIRQICEVIAKFWEQHWHRGECSPAAHSAGVLGPKMWAMGKEHSRWWRHFWGQTLLITNLGGLLLCR